eukprot:gene10325-7219_t
MFPLLERDVGGRFPTRFLYMYTARRRMIVEPSAPDREGEGGGKGGGGREKHRERETERAERCSMGKQNKQKKSRADEEVPQKEMGKGVKFRRVSSPLVGTHTSTTPHTEEGEEEDVMLSYLPPSERGGSPSNKCNSKLRCEEEIGMTIIIFPLCYPYFTFIFPPFFGFCLFILSPLFSLEKQKFLSSVPSFLPSFFFSFMVMLPT